MIERRKGTKFIAAFGKGPPLHLEPKGDRIVVKRAGKTIAGIRGDRVIRAAPECECDGLGFTDRPCPKCGGDF